MRERLKELRTALDLTQQEFADSLKLKRGSIANIESGINNLTDRNVDLICTTHNVNETWLRTGTEEMFNIANEDDEFDILVGRLYAENDNFKKKFIKSMLSLTDDEWIVVKKFVDNLK